MLNLILTHLGVARPSVSPAIHTGTQHEPEFWILHAR